eukprot:Skav232121  [mRNA]  locus=scaffold2353:203752:206310:+ [translate_table: standard]
MCAGWLHQAGEKHGVVVFDSFTQRTTRFLFEPNETFWAELAKKKDIDSSSKQEVRVEVRTVLPHGMVETRSWLRSGKGIFAFTLAADLDKNRDVGIQPPYTFLRDDKTKAVVQMWTKTIDQRLKKNFDMVQIRGAFEPGLTSAEKMAYSDFQYALIKLFGEELVKHAKIYKCIEHKESVNKHLWMEGRLKDILAVLKENPWTAHHYFRCTVSEVNHPGICANLGFGKGSLAFYPGTLEARVVLYIRQGTQKHACFQSFETFALDSRKPAKGFTEISNPNLGVFLKLKQLGQGGEGSVFEVIAKEGPWVSRIWWCKGDFQNWVMCKYKTRMTNKYALKLPKKRVNEQNVQREIKLAQELMHKFFVSIYECDEMFLHGFDGISPSMKGILMELADTSLDKEVLHIARVEEARGLDLEWLRQCRIWMAQMVSAVDYMHKKKIIHRDLKPSNMLLSKGADSKSSLIKVTDFGFSVRDDCQPLLQPVGTEDYMAPEMKAELPVYSMKCDVYSLAKTFEAILQRWKRKFKVENEERELLRFDSNTFSYPTVLSTLIYSMSLPETTRLSMEAVREDRFFEAYKDGIAAIHWQDL